MSSQGTDYTLDRVKRRIAQWHKSALNAKDFNFLDRLDEVEELLLEVDRKISELEALDNAFVVAQSAESWRKIDADLQRLVDLFDDTIRRATTVPTEQEKRFLNRVFVRPLGGISTLVRKSEQTAYLERHILELNSTARKGLVREIDDILELTERGRPYALVDGQRLVRLVSRLLYNFSGEVWSAFVGTLVGLALSIIISKLGYVPINDR